MYQREPDNNVRPEKIVTNFQQQGDFYQYKSWSYNSDPYSPTSKGYNDCLCFVLVSKGFFSFDLGSRNYEMHSGHIIIDKPHYEYTLHPGKGHCSVFNFTDALYEMVQEEFQLHKTAFFSNPDKLAQMLRATPAIDYLHHRLLESRRLGGTMEMDVLVGELLKRVMEGATGHNPDLPHLGAINKMHLSTIDEAREYMNTHFLEDISLTQLSKHCCVSPFYLSRLFKAHTGVPPYKYLQEVRLQHAALLLRHSNMPVGEICFSSGFNNPDYFTAAFTKRFNVAPSLYKSSL